MMAAVAAARQGAEVTLFERNDRIGKKLLATGNGKCNLGNMRLSETEYYGSRAEWISECLKRFGTGDTIQFFQGIGLLIKEKNGYLYPACEQAAVVLDVLRITLKELRVHIVTDCKINRIVPAALQEKGSTRIVLYAGEKSYAFDSVVIACGSKAAPKTGSDGSGYKLAGQLKHSVVPVAPALVQLRCREDYLKSVSGVRCDARISILDEQRREIASERGELQLTDYGISGIAVFQLSRIVNYMLREKKEVVVRIDLLPGFSGEEYRHMKEQRASLQKGKNAEEYFTGTLNKKLVMLFLKMAGLKPSQSMESADKKAVEQVFSFFRSWELHVTGSNPYENAQVCAGGVDTREITGDMESKKVPGVFFAGEILDVDGKCGGYNLQWAWCSGYLAGRAAAGKKTQEEIY